MKNLKDSKKQLILLIDDNKDNLNFLCDIFDDFRKAVTTSGLEGIQLANKLKPDLILLDIMMPDISGYDVCKKIKDNPDNKDIPIIFLSGKANLDDVVTGFELGAVDYITKPFHKDELIMRVKKNLELKASRDLIEKQKEELHYLNEELKNFLNIAAHDLKNSIIIIKGFLKIILQNYEKFSDNDKLEILNDVSMTSDGMYKILTNLLLISKLETSSVKPQENIFEPNFLVSESINYFDSLAKVKKIKINYLNNESNLKVLSDYNLIKECFDNLLSNAIKFSPKESEIIVTFSVLANSENDVKYMIIEVKDNGSGIDEKELELLFKKFSRLSTHPTNQENTTGLGLALTKMITDLLNGTVKYEPNKPKGSIFILKLPIVLVS